MRNGKLEIRNEKWEMRKEQIITHQYNSLFLIFKLFICQLFYLYHYLDAFHIHFLFLFVCKRFALFFVVVKLWNIFSRHSALYLITKKHARIIKMDKKRLKIALSVLDVVRSRSPETNEFIDSTLKEECEKERMIADEVIFYKFKSKKLA